MAWIESHQELGRHPKTKKLARLLGVSHPTAVGHLFYLWWWALDFAQDGLIGKHDDEIIAEEANWEGDPAVFVDAIKKAGFADETDEGLVLHDWYDYAGKLLERRAKDRDRKRENGKNSGSSSEIQRNSEGNQEDDEGSRTASEVTVHNSTVHNSTEQNTTLHDTTEQEPTLCETRFAEFWKLYPKKVGKPACLKAWKKLKPNAELFEQIMASLQWQRESEQWNREGGRFIPNPLTWLNQGRWDSEPTETAGTATGKTGSTLDKLRRMYAEEGGDE